MAKSKAKETIWRDRELERIYQEMTKQEIQDAMRFLDRQRTKLQREDTFGQSNPVAEAISDAVLRLLIARRLFENVLIVYYEGGGACHRCGNITRTRGSCEYCSD